MLGQSSCCEVAVGSLDPLLQLLFSIETASRTSGGDTDTFYLSMKQTNIFVHVTLLNNF